MSWADTRDYLACLRQLTGKGYRLLSEAEWEYACRAGTTTPLSTGATITTAQANYNGNAVPFGSGPWNDYGAAVAKEIFREGPTPVGAFPPDPFGLCDMHGNVTQWVADCYNRSYKGAPSDGSAWETPYCTNRMIRGGSWRDTIDRLRSACRSWCRPSWRSTDLGFRVARTL